MNDYHWFNQHQPQTLQSAVVLLYINAAFGLLLGSYVSILVLVAMAVGAFGTANDKKWGYGLAVASALVNFVVVLLLFGLPDALTTFNGLISVLFDGALVALLLHPMSRDYQRIWFR